MTALLWLRRDLRLHDHPALQSALAEGGPLVPVFCFDPVMLSGRHRSGPRTLFLLDCLHDLAASLEAAGSGLVVCHGRPERELPALARRLEATVAWATDDAGPYARARDARVARLLGAVGVHLRLASGLTTIEEPVLTRSGKSFVLFSPYYRAWLQGSRRMPFEAPSSLPPLPTRLDVGSLPSLEDIGLGGERRGALRGGERMARDQMSVFLASGLGGYASMRERVDLDSTSRLSPFLHFGCLSARELEDLAELRCTQAPGRADASRKRHLSRAFPVATDRSAGDEKARQQGVLELRRQLCWRDFYAQLMRASPELAHLEHQRRYRGRLAWSEDRELFAAWCSGRTGYPLVDAAMRQLEREGWIHNRLRLVVGSFLTKDLGIDWRWGERWFMRLLLDGDEASNNGNWQWIASVGVDPNPPVRRIYNPTRQLLQFDPDGSYVRRYVPELAKVPDRHLPEPWRMPAELQGQIRCVIGRDYPYPIVDHAKARLQAMERYASARTPDSSPLGALSLAE